MSKAAQTEKTEFTILATSYCDLLSGLCCNLQLEVNSISVLYCLAYTADDDILLCLTGRQLLVMAAYSMFVERSSF